MVDSKYVIVTNPTYLDLRQFHDDEVKRGTLRPLIRNDLFSDNTDDKKILYIGHQLGIHFILYRWNPDWKQFVFEYAIVNKIFMYGSNNFRLINTHTAEVYCKSCASKHKLSNLEVKGVYKNNYYCKQGGLLFFHPIVD